MTLDLEYTLLGRWPVPVWSRGVPMADGSFYCFADMKGAVCRMDCVTGEIERLAQLPVSVSSDIACVTIGDEEGAAIVDHDGNSCLVMSDGRVRDLEPVGEKVRAGLRVARSPDGTDLLALTSAAPFFELIDPSEGGQCIVRVSLGHFPEQLGQGVVAAPLLFRHGGRDKVFLVTRYSLVYQVDLASGLLDWSMPLPYGVDSDPVIDSESGYILFSTGESLGGEVTGFLYAYDPSQRHIVWRAPLQGGSDVQPLVVDWQGERIVVTATLRDAAVYAFRLADGSSVARADIPETDRCSHRTGACIPVGYGNYHTQTTICKVYAAPFALRRSNGDCDSVLVVSHNGTLYGFRPGESLNALNLPGAVRASPAFLSDRQAILHAGDALISLDAGEGRFSGGDAATMPFHLSETPDGVRTSIKANMPWQMKRYGMKQIGKFTNKKVYY